ncbi:saccharopine dehydrogenase [bacterium]|nr:MAG: saccharopine dehydrogenase [bacterium]
MKRILVLGAGQSAGFLIAQLLEESEQENWFVTIGDLDPEPIRAEIADHPRAEAIQFDVNDAGLRSTQIKQTDLVINMLPASYQDLVAWDCVNHGRHMLSVSYRDQSVRDLDPDAKRKGVLLLCEIGLDPGIDHMSAISLIRKLEADGGRIVSFCSYGSGIPAPGQPHNPLRYVLTWDARNVVMAGFEGAQYMEDGKITVVPYHHLFHHTWAVDVEGVGMLEAYANRDSLSYMQTFGLSEVRTMIRGTLRYPGWSETWAQIVRLGLPNETLRIPDLARRSYAEVLEMHLPLTVTGSSIEQRLGNFLRISPTGTIMEKLRWLGLLSDEPTGCEGETAAAMMIDVLADKLALEPGQRDMIVLFHELEVEYPGQERARETITSTLVERGDPDGTTAMARTVGLPTAVAVKLLLCDEIPLTGSQIPTHPSIYEPVLKELEASGVAFSERVLPHAEQPEPNAGHGDTPPEHTPEIQP